MTAKLSEDCQTVLFATIDRTYECGAHGGYHYGQHITEDMDLDKHTKELVKLGFIKKNTVGKMIVSVDINDIALKYAYANGYKNQKQVEYFIVNVADLANEASDSIINLMEDDEK